MPREVERRVVELVAAIYGGEPAPVPEWLMRPGRAECKRKWPLVRRLYSDLTGLELPEVMPSRERRQLDAILVRRGEAPRILEVDESQHFNEFRSRTLRAYPSSVKLAFPKSTWIAQGDSKRRLEGGGWGRPKPPLFPGENGRHRQRAFRDALADVLPLAYGWEPTLRIGDFEVLGWINGPDAERRMKELLASRSLSL